MQWVGLFIWLMVLVALGAFALTTFNRLPDPPRLDPSAPLMARLPKRVRQVSFVICLSNLAIVTLPLFGVPVSDEQILALIVVANWWIGMGFYYLGRK